MTATATVLALGARERADLLGQVVDDLVARRLLVVDDLAESFVSFARQRQKGTRALRQVIGARMRDGWVPPASELERRLYELLDEVGLVVVRQPRAPWSPEGAGRVDALLPEAGVVVEADGRRWHTRVDDFERDRERDTRAAAAGLVVVRFTWRQLVDQLAECRRMLEQVVAARVGARWGVPPGSGPATLAGGGDRPVWDRVRSSAT